MENRYTNKLKSVGMQRDLKTQKHLPPLVGATFQKGPSFTLLPVIVVSLLLVMIGVILSPWEGFWIFPVVLLGFYLLFQGALSR